MLRRPPTSTLFPYTTLFRSLCGTVSSHGRGTDPLRKALSAAVRERARVDERAAVASHRRGVSRSAGIAGRRQPHRGPGARADGRRAGWCQIRDLPTRRRPGHRTGSAVPGRREDPGRAFARAGVDHGIDTLRPVAAVQDHVRDQPLPLPAHAPSRIRTGADSPGAPAGRGRVRRGIRRSGALHASLQIGVRTDPCAVPCVEDASAFVSRAGLGPSREVLGGPGTPSHSHVGPWTLTPQRARVPSAPQHATVMVIATTVTTLEAQGDVATVTLKRGWGRIAGRDETRTENANRASAPQSFARSR